MKPEEEFQKNIKIIQKSLVALFCFVGIFACVLIYLIVDPSLSAFSSEDSEEYLAAEELYEDRIENGIHVPTGLIDAEGLTEVVNNCTNCHSAKLVTQNRMSKERWEATIDWMQETQNLWDLGRNEEIIVNYLVANYPPTEKGRRQNLTDIDWYELEN